MTAFLRKVYGDGDIEVLAERYLDDEGRDHGQDLTAFFVSLKDKAPKSQSLMLGAVRVFLSEYGIELPQRFWRRLLDDDPDNPYLLEKLAELLEIRGRVNEAKEARERAKEARKTRMK